MPRAPRCTGHGHLTLHPGFCACAGCLALAAGNPASYAPRTNTTAQVPSTGAIFTLYSDMQTYLGSAASCSNSNSTTLASVVSADEMAAVNSLAVAFWSSDAGQAYLSAPASPPAQPGQPGSLGFWNASLFSGCVWIGATWPCCSGVGRGRQPGKPSAQPSRTLCVDALDAAMSLGRRRGGRRRRSLGHNTGGKGINGPRTSLEAAADSVGRNHSRAGSRSAQGCQYPQGVHDRPAMTNNSLPCMHPPFIRPCRHVQPE